MRAVGLRWTFLAVLLPCLLGLLLSLAAFYRLEKAETEKGALQLVRSSSARVDGALLGAQHALQGLAATSSELDRMDMRAFRQQALQFMAASGYGNAIVLIDRDGQQLMNTLLPYASPLPKTGNRAATDHVFAHGQPYISSLFNGAVARRPLLSISVPVIRDGKVRYNLTMGMNAEALAPFVSAQLLPAGWGLVIYDRSGVIAARTRSPEKLIGHKVIPALLDRLHGPDEGLINSVSLDGEAIVGAYHRSGQTGYAVAVGVPESVLNAPLYRKLFFPALVLLSIGLLSMLLLRRATTRMQSSLHAFTLAIDAASQQQADCHVPANGPAEFVRLANRFNHMQDLRRGAELTLREVEHFAGIGRWEWDLASNRHVWSHELYHIYDHPPASPALAYPELLRCFGADGAVQIAAHIEHCLASGTPFQCDVPLQHSDGMPRWVFMTGSAQRDAQGNIIKLQGLVQDISARKQTERVLARLNRAMHLVSECNDELVRAADEAALLASICRLVVDTGGYLMAWIGVALDDAAQSIRPVAQSGVEHGYLESIRISWGDNPLGQGPTGMAYRMRSTQTNQNCLTNPKMAPWREAALRCGYQASIALPLLAGDSLHGILTIYAREPDAFQHDEVALLEQLANDLAYGIAALRNEEHRKQAVAQQQASEQRYRTVLDNAADAVMITSGDGRITYANHEAAKLLGYPPEQLRDMTLADLAPAGERQKAQGIPAQLADSHQLRLEMTLQSVDDTQIPVEINAVALPDGHVYAACRDITERKQFEAELEYSATHDTLTGLANRHLLHDRIAQAMARARREQYSVALMLLDLDRFKTINDTLNHDAGDSLLREVAQRLQQQVRDGDTVARLGGDEFMVVMGDITSDDDAALLAERLLASIRQPLLAAGHHLVVTGSLGISLYPRDGDSVDELIKNADVAMYRAKALGRDEFQFYAPDMNTRMLGRLELENSLRQALQNNELTLHYQAKANIADNRIDGAEALIRWHRPGHGMVSPAQFIPLAEETGLILAIGSWVIREACRQLQQWQQQGLPPVSVAINLSARQFQQKGLAAMVAQQIADHGLHPGVIELEITESALMVDPEQAQHILQELHQTGIRIALDDFGTGYSSLNYLKRFPVDILKIDQSFVRDMNTDPQDVAIARMVIELGHALGMSVVAEGVETEQQRARLQQLGCDVMQGYLFSKPLPAAQFAALLAGATASA